LRNKIADLEKDIKALTAQQKTALKPAVVPEARPKGVVRVVNQYGRDISIVINDISYRVASNTKIEVEVPTGTFTYQLLESGASATTTPIKENQPVTLNIK
jgi:hypothetical protein